LAVFNKSFWIRVKHKLIAQWAKLQDFVTLFIRYSSRKLKQLALPVQRLFGYSIIQHRQEAKRADLSAFLSDTDKKIAELPDEYHQWFKMDKVFDAELYVNTATHKTSFKSALEGWEKGLGTNMIVIGERGGGKSSLINLLKAEIESAESLTAEISGTMTESQKLVALLSETLGFEPMNKVEVLIKRIKQMENKKVLFLEGLQNLFLRHINGFEALEKLGLILNETKEQIFWVVSCSRYAWNFLNKALGLEANFAYTLETDRLSEEDIQKVIMNRQENSGYSTAWRK